MISSKEILRKKYLVIRKNLEPNDCYLKSLSAQQKFLDSTYYLKSEVIGLYSPILNEVQTFQIMAQAILNLKTVCLPAIIDNHITFFKYNPTKDLKIGKYGIMEPDKNGENMNHLLDIVITPGIVFDEKGGRIGYGKGYYDKFFNSSTSQKMNRVGLAYDFQLLMEKIPCNAQDAKMNTIVSDKRLINIS